MSRCVNLNHAREKASANWSGFSRNRRDIFSYSGSNRNDKSVVSIVGKCFLELSKASGIIGSAFFATHWCAPAGLLESSHSKPNKFSKKLLLHCVGVFVQVTSRPLVMASVPLPEPKLFFQPKPCSSKP